LVEKLIIYLYETYPSLQHRDTHIPDAAMYVQVSNITSVCIC